jgi:hypothetical protein
MEAQEENESRHNLSRSALRDIKIIALPYV